MNVKRYIAPNVQEAMIKIKSELGRDAIILNTRKIRQKGIKGLFKKNFVEVLAAIEESNVVQSPKSAKTVKPVPAVIPQIKSVKEEPKKSVEENKQIDGIQSEVDEIKQMLKSLISKENVSEVKTEDVQHDKTNKEEGNLESYIRELLAACEIKENIIEKIIMIVKRQISNSNTNENVIKSAVKQAIKEYLGTPFTIDHYLGNQRVFLFVGPTGVGKTTTLAKLAAKLSLVDNKKVGLITADTYRIAAVDQLKTYSEILGIPLSVVYEASELEDVLYRYRDRDIILLDTAGRSHKSEGLSNDLEELLVNIENPEIFLVISLTTGYKDIISIVNAYSFIDEYKLIFTKLDEASSFSNILNVKVESGKNLSYLTTGQSVPDDIEIANADKITEYIVGEAK